MKKLMKSTIAFGGFALLLLGLKKIVAVLIADVIRNCDIILYMTKKERLKLIKEIVERLNKEKNESK